MTDFTPRPTTYDGVKMRSRLEAGFAAWLDERKAEWEYEPGAFGGPEGQYLPDFRVQLLDGRVDAMATAYIEVKPTPPDPNPDLFLAQNVGWETNATPHLNALGRRMGIIWNSEPDALLLLVWATVGGKLAVLPPRPGPPAPWPDGYWNVAGSVSGASRNRKALAAQVIPSWSTKPGHRAGMKMTPA